MRAVVFHGAHDVRIDNVPLPTGYQAAENGNIQGGETVAIWGCGPVGQFTIKSAFMLGAGRVIAIDRFGERLEMARRDGGAETMNYKEDGCIKVVMKP